MKLMGLLVSHPYEFSESFLSTHKFFIIAGDPIGLTRLFLLFVGNRDVGSIGLRSYKLHTYANALGNASGLIVSKIGSFINFLRFKLLMDNSEKGGSLKNM